MRNDDDRRIHVGQDVDELPYCVVDPANDHVGKLPRPPSAPVLDVIQELTAVGSQSLTLVGVEVGCVCSPPAGARGAAVAHPGLLCQPKLT